MAIVRWFWNLVLGAAVGVAFAGQASASTEATSQWQGVQHVIGFDGVPASAKGDLEVGTKGIAFFAGNQWKSVPLSRIESAQVGSERQETGGKVGKVTRVLVPYGGGALVGLATQRGVGLLSIRYRDSQDGLHETLLLMPQAQAIEAQQALVTLIRPDSGHHNSASQCSLKGSFPAIRIAVENEDRVAPEYEAAIFEHLVADVRGLWPEAAIFRGLQEQSTCRAVTLTLKLVDLQKGNAVKRASTGPLGLFIGVTRVEADVLLQGLKGNEISEHSYKASRRGDRESLGVASSIASSITKDLAREDLNQAPPTE
jgi:hypothetical protein